MPVSGSGKLWMAHPSRNCRNECRGNVSKPRRAISSSGLVGSLLSFLAARRKRLCSAQYAEENGQKAS